MSKLNVKDLDTPIELDCLAAGSVLGGKRYKFGGAVLPGVDKLVVLDDGKGGKKWMDGTGLVTDIYDENGDYTEEAAAYLLSGDTIPLF